MKKGFVLLTFVFLAIAYAVSAQDLVIVNSDQWQDVYTGMVYANIKGADSQFVTDYNQGIDLVKLLDPAKGAAVQLVQSSNPLVPSMQGLLKDKGFTVELIQGNPTQNTLALLKRSGASKVILLDDAYAYNAVSVGGYASASKSMPLFVNRNNAPEMIAQVDALGAKSVLLYGSLDRTVKEAFAGKATTETIDTGDKFSNNFQIIKRHLQISNRGQILMTDGNNLEKEILLGNDPVILVGESYVPPEVITMLKDSNITIGVAIGTEIIGNAKTIKEQAGLKIFVKFAQGRNSVQYPLDRYPLPHPVFSLQIVSINYNPLTKQLELTLKNPAKNYVTYKGDYDLRAAGGERASLTRFADTEGVYVPGESEITKTYGLGDVDPFATGQQDLSLDFRILQGADVKSLEALLTGNNPVTVKGFDDASNVTLKSIQYDQDTKRFVISYQNERPEPAYLIAFVRLQINGETQVFSSEKTNVAANGAATLKVRAILEPVDIEDNQEYLLITRFGGRENALVKQTAAQVQMQIRQPVERYMVYGAIAVVALIVLWFAFGRKSKHRKHAE